MKEVKKIKNKISVEKDHVELNVPDNSNKLKYIVGGLLIIGGICFALWYFDLFSSDKPSTGSNPTQRSNTNLGQGTGYFTSHVTDLPSNYTTT